LAEHGFAKYVDAFASNDVDLDVLPELTDADLKDLGVASLGDRKRLLKAIASLASAEKSSVDCLPERYGASRRLDTTSSSFMRSAAFNKSRPLSKLSE
jgi:SAM domain (Sterile alpha motif)